MISTYLQQVTLVQQYSLTLEDTLLTEKYKYPSLSTYAVSYTHLDVYKRQDGYCLKIYVIYFS